VVKQANGFSYEELAFHLADSQSYRAFCLIGFADKPPKKSTLQRNLKQVRAETLERINRALVANAQQQGIEDGRRLRSDATVVESAIHEPTDSSLLVDCVRVLTRLLREAREYVALDFTNHLRRAKRRGLAIQHTAKAEQRVPLYRDRVRVAILRHSRCVGVLYPAMPATRAVSSPGRAQNGGPPVSTRTFPVFAAIRNSRISSIRSVRLTAPSAPCR
jgi:IS5 family transposase